jgi:hypothetical protein
MTAEQIEQLLERCKRRGPEYTRGVADTWKQAAETVTDLAISLDDRKSGTQPIVGLLIDVASDFRVVADAVQD